MKSCGSGATPFSTKANFGLTYVDWGKLTPNSTLNITLAYSSSPFKLFDRLAIPFAEVAWDTANP